MGEAAEETATTMPGEGEDHGLTTPRPRERRWPLLSLGAALVLLAWLLARFSPFAEAAPPNEDSFSYNLIVASALPWFLQWAGVVCAILGWFRSRYTRKAALFAIPYSFTLAAIWWGGLAWRFRGLDSMDGMSELVLIKMKSLVGGSTLFDEVLFDFIGPVLGPLQLRGPFHLQGWTFLWTMLSTGLLVGYLLVAGHLCRVGSRAYSARDFARFIAAMLPIFLPPCIRLGIEIARAH